MGKCLSLARELFDTCRRAFDTVKGYVSNSSRASVSLRCSERGTDAGQGRTVCGATFRRVSGDGAGQGPGRGGGGRGGGAERPAL